MLLRHRWAWSIVAAVVAGIVGQGYLGIYDPLEISLFQLGVALLVGVLPVWADPPNWWFRALRGEGIKRARQRDLYESGFKTRRPFYLVVLKPSMSLEELTGNPNLRSMLDWALGSWWEIDHEQTQQSLVLVIGKRGPRRKRKRARARNALPKTEVVYDLR